MGAMSKRDPYYKREAARYDHPIASREFILSLMDAKGEPLDFQHIAREAEAKTPEQQQALKLRLAAMLRDGQLVAGRRHHYAIPSRLSLIAGRVSAHRDGFGFLICDEERDDIFLPHGQIRRAFHGDRALVRLRGQDRRGRDTGEIVEVLERNTKELVGRVYFENSIALFEALNRRINHEMLIEGDTQPLNPGQIAVAEVVEQPSHRGLPKVRVLDILGEHLTPEMEVEIALRNHDIPYEFTDEAIEEADSLPAEVARRDKSGRRDLRDKPFVTIDGEDAKDFDDAVYCEPRSKGGWQLYVAIADVAHYVKPDSPLDEEAVSRGTSVYFPQYVVPMLPEKLSNGLCSLKPAVDRLALVCEMTLSAAGRLGNYQFYEAVIHSHGRLTYTEVGAALGSGKFGPHGDNLQSLHALYKTLVTRREDRGALDLETSEVSFEFDDTGRVAGIKPVVRNDAHRIIEECMLCANVCAARLIAKSDLPGLYRVHERPEVQKIGYLREFLEAIGCSLGGGDLPAPADFRAAAQQLAKMERGNILQVMLLRAMQQAVYQPQNVGHFGLAFKEYAHFTSPIRRYPDLLVHRLIKSLIHSPDCQLKEVSKQGTPQAGHTYDYSVQQMIALGEELSTAERRADDAVYEVLEWVKCDFISDHLGEEFDGVITGVSKFGIFVQIQQLYVEGLVHLSTLIGDYYHYEQGIQVLIGERTGQCLGMGDSVKIQVARVDVDERKVDFELLAHTPLKRRKVPKLTKSPQSKQQKKWPKRESRHRGATRRRRR